MNSEFELIRYNRRLPARIEIKEGAIETPYHWHKEIELVYVLDGALEITVNNAAQTLRVNEFRLINSVENHSLSAENVKCLILDISYEFATRFDKTLYSSVFKVVSGSGAEEELRNLLWQLSRTTDESELPDLRQYGLITDLLHCLYSAAMRIPTLSKRAKTSSHATSSWQSSISNSIIGSISRKTLLLISLVFSLSIWQGALRKRQARPSQSTFWSFG